MVVQNRVWVWGRVQATFFRMTKVLKKLWLVEGTMSSVEGGVEGYIKVVQRRFKGTSG